jgi:hypothetical protein
MLGALPAAGVSALEGWAKSAGAEDEMARNGWRDVLAMERSVVGRNMVVNDMTVYENG